MRSTFVCVFVLLLAVGLTAGRPLSAQRVEARFSDLAVSQVEPGARPTPALGTIPGPGQAAASTSDSPGSAFWSVATVSTIGGGTGMLLGGLAGRAVNDYYLPLFTGAIGTTVGTSLGVGIAGSDHGVNPFEALFSGVWGFGGGVAMANLLDDRTSDAVLIGGFIAAQGLTAAILGWLFAD